MGVQILAEKGNIIQLLDLFPFEQGKEVALDSDSARDLGAYTDNPRIISAVSAATSVPYPKSIKPII